MPGYFALVLHAHLPFVRHPEHERFLEESWLFEAITETYLPLVDLLAGWRRDRLAACLTLTLSPTLCAMLRDPLLQRRYDRHLTGLIELATKETYRTHWEPALCRLAEEYHRRFLQARETWHAWAGDLVAAFAEFQRGGQIEIITCAATHALLPLSIEDTPALRAQVLTACDDYRACFGRAPRGIWLPECAYAPELEPVLHEAGPRWFILDTHGLLLARPSPPDGVYAPVVTPHGLAAFGRDPESAKQVWSRQEGYPGDPRYRDFYRDIGFDLDFEYLEPYLPSPSHRGFTGIKYHRITGGVGEKQVYDREAALAVAQEHAAHFRRERVAQFDRLAGKMDRPPLIVAPYDAELFGHWWHEGPEFLDAFARQTLAEPGGFDFVTPSGYLERHAANPLAQPAAFSWGEAGHWRVWLNEKNAWIFPHLRVARQRMSELARRFPAPAALPARALRQAARELLLAEASDWPFILNSGTSPEYARRRLQDHLLRFTALYEQLLAGRVQEGSLRQVEAQDNLFPAVNYRYWM